MTRIAAALLLLASCGAPPRAVPSAEEERVLRPVADASDEVRGLVERGDDLFLRALGAHRGNDVDAALDLYARARASYLEAQTRYPSLTPVPPPLLDRVRECVTRIAALQRQKHAR